MEERFWLIEETARQLEPTFVAMSGKRNGESHSTLRGERRGLVVDACPILHEKPKFNAFEKMSPVSEENATQDRPTPKKGSRLNDLGADDHSALFHKVSDQVR